ncbi:MAG: hypothetical protein ACKODX_06995 [Gemmata sp.]
MRNHCWVVGVLLCAGCGGSNVVPVSGTVKLNGQPLANATVSFTPAEGAAPGPGSIGTTDANGRYTLQVATTNAPGAVIGKHRVSITAHSGGDPSVVPSSAPPAPGDKPVPASKSLVPEEYNSKTTLTFDVPKGGTSSADFDMTVPK